MDKIKIQVLPLAESITGNPVVMGTLRAEDYAEIYDVDQYDPNSEGDIGDDGEGYQRSEEEARVQAYVKSLTSKQSDTNTAIICNVRNFDKKDYTEEGGVFYLSINKKEIELYVGDGQHRSAGYKNIMDDPEFKEAFKETPLPVIFYLGEDLDHEKLTFFNTNFYSKSVPVNNKQELQIGLAPVKPKIKKAIELMKLIRKDSEVWKDKLIKPNSKIGLVNSSGFTTSINQHIATQSWFESLDINTLFVMLDAFWQGVRNTLPECFNEPDKYALQKAVGINVMHSIFPFVFMQIKDHGEEVSDPKAWEKYLGYLKKHKSDNRETPPRGVEGHEFWLTGKSGGAGRYSSAAGKAELIDIFKNAIK